MQPLDDEKEMTPTEASSNAIIPCMAREYCAILQTRFQTWNEVTGGKLVS